MNLDFHYFVIKTLACTAGFSEEDAQTIAYYSQQVDDFTKSSPMRVRQDPPVYFVEKGYAWELDNGLWEVQPHPTGIDIIQSLEKHYRHTTLVLLHVLPLITVHYRSTASYEGILKRIELNANEGYYCFINPEMFIA